jgi:hypothetical protein
VSIGYLWIYTVDGILIRYVRIMDIYMSMYRACYIDYIKYTRESTPSSSHHHPIIIPSSSHHHPIIIPHHPSPSRIPNHPGLIKFNPRVDFYQNIRTHAVIFICEPICSHARSLFKTKFNHHPIIIPSSSLIIPHHIIPDHP